MKKVNVGVTISVLGCVFGYAHAENKSVQIQSEHVTSESMEMLASALSSNEVKMEIALSVASLTNKVSVDGNAIDLSVLFTEQDTPK